MFLGIFGVLCHSRFEIAFVGARAQQFHLLEKNDEPLLVHRPKFILSVRPVTSACNDHQLRLSNHAQNVIAIVLMKQFGFVSNSVR